MMPAVLVLFASQVPISWPPEKGNNGYDFYVRAAKLVDCPFWKQLLDRKSPEARSAATPLDLCRLEAQAGRPILDLLVQGNSIPTRDPYPDETPATVHPEFGYLLQVVRVVCDSACAESSDGHMDQAMAWLEAGETFAYRFPVNTSISAVVQIRYLNMLDPTAMALLPKMTPPQLDEEIALSKQITENPPDMEAAARHEARGFRDSVEDLVGNPGDLGLDDELPDIESFLGALLEMKSEMPKDEEVLLAELMKKIPAFASDDPSAMLAALQRAERNLPPKEMATYRKLIARLTPVLKPKTIGLREFAKTLSANEKAHAANVVDRYAGQPYRDLEAAFAEPEARWGIPFKSKPVQVDNSAWLADALAGPKIRQTDFYALKIAAVLESLGPLVSGGARTAVLLSREKRRLFLIHAKIARYRAWNRKLPETLAPIGSPVDPVSRQPYEYKKLDSWNYTLAAVGVPGLGRIEMDSRIPRR